VLHGRRGAARIDPRRLDARHAGQRLLDVPHTRAAGHACHGIGHGCHAKLLSGTPPMSRMTSSTGPLPMVGRPSGSVAGKVSSPERWVATSEDGDYPRDWPSAVQVLLAHVVLQAGKGSGESMGGLAEAKLKPT
jgi:hypothetical protein